MLALTSTPILTQPSSITCLRKTFQFGSNAGSKTAFRVSLRMSFKTPCPSNNLDRFVGVSCVGGVEKGELEIDDRFYMKMGIELARKATGCTSPNPMVGCVIVKDGKVVGEGFHPKAGQPHAEVFALRDAGDLAENATAYVTLEPCNHYGRTPPCTEALIKAKVKKVVVGMVDPNPIVASKGVDRLRAAGIQVSVGIEEDLCQKLNEAYIHQMLTGKPFVTLRYSLSMNGQFLNQLGDGAMASGGYYSQLLRESDAVIFSPASSIENLSTIASKKTGNNRPFQIIISRAHTPVKFENISSDESSKVIIFTEEEAIQEQETSQKGIETVVCDQVSLEKILEYCKQQGLCNVLVDLRGDFENLEELLQEGINKNLLQKIVVEVLPQWSVESYKFKSIERRLKIKNLRPISLVESVVLEGYVDV